MQCLKPIRIVDQERHTSTMVPCGRCEACLANKATDWVTRLKIEAFYSTSAYFVTLTYADPFLPHSWTKDEAGNKVPVPGFSKDDCQRFLKNLRAKVPDKLRYFLVAEYGKDSLRPHYHLCLFNWPPEVDPLTNINKSWISRDGRLMQLPMDNTVEPLELGHILYVTKYIHKKQQVPKGWPKPFMLCSRRPGIGSQILTDQNLKFYRDKPSTFVYVDGEQMYMPRYLKDKIYNDYDRKKALLLTKMCYANTRKDKPLGILARLGYKEIRHCHVEDVVSVETGEISPRLVMDRVDLGTVSWSDRKRVDMILKTPQRDFVRKKQKNINDSYHF